MRFRIFLILSLLTGSEGMHLQNTFAQGNTGSIGGVTLDKQHLAIQKVSLSIENLQSGLKRSQLSGSDGSFEFSGLLPGEYRLIAEISGFQRSELRIPLEVNQRVRVDVMLAVGVLDQEVQVIETAPLLHSSDASVGEVVDQEHVSELPLNGRQFLELSLLVPGVHHSHGAQTGETNALYWRPGQNSAVSISGGRPNSNTYLLDGTVNTDPSFNTYVISLAPDIIREFQIQTGTYTAELGGAGTGQVNVVTKSGTNQIHASVYEYLRNSALDARLFTSPAELPHFSQNQFGGTIGGPVQHDRTFYFGAFEGFRSSQRQSMIMSVPNLMQRMGDFSEGPAIFDPTTTRPNPDFDPSRPASATNPRQIRSAFPNNQIPMERMNPVAWAVLTQFVPMPNLDGAGGMGGMAMGNGVNNFLDTRAQLNSFNQFNGRVDHSFANGGSVFGRYSLSNERGFTPENLPGFGAYHDNRVQNLTLTSTHPFSPSQVNEFRFGLERMRLHRYAENANGPDLVGMLGIPGVGFGGPEAYGLPRFVVQGLEPFGDALLATPSRYWNTIFQWSDRLTWIHGPHSLKFGGDVRRFRWDMLGFFQNRGFFQFTPGFTTQTATNDGTGNALASFLLGLPVLSQRQAGIPSMNMRQTYFDGFIQDDWRLLQGLTLNFGLRYELSTPLADIHKILTNLDWINGVPMAYAGGQTGFPLGLAFTDRNNFALRLGLAYAPGQGKTVFRTGYGIFYSYPDMNLWCNQVHNVPLVFPEAVQSDNFIPAASGFGFAPPVLGKTLVSFTALDPHARTPIVQQASFTLERQLSDSTMIQLGYVGAFGKKLDRARLVNNAQPGPGPVRPRRPFKTIAFVEGTELPENLPIQSMTFPVGAINLLENSASSSYQSGFILAKRKFSKGLTFLSSYTYAKSMTDAPAFRSPAMESEVPQDSFNLGNEWSRAGCDIRHRFATSLIYRFPLTSSQQFSHGFLNTMKYLLGDWQIATIYQLQSGFPFTVGVFGDTANAGSLLNINPVRANVVPGVSGELPAGEKNADRWFNTSAFTTPPAFTFGNVGRNTLDGPSLNKADIALERHFSLGEVRQVQFRAEFFNAFNHTNLDTPGRFVNTPQFGIITMAATPARQIQFALRLSF
jgi:hypothetical protein